MRGEPAHKPLTRRRTGCGRHDITGSAYDRQPMTRSPTTRVHWHVGERSSSLGDDKPVIGWEELRGGWIAELRSTGMRRRSQDSPARPWLDWLAETDELAVVDVVLDGPVAAADLLGFVVEPALRLGIELEILADRRLEDCDAEAFHEPEFGYAHALERLRFVIRAPAPRRGAPAKLPDGTFAPEEAQRRAVQAGEGVVQIIAPAGSGKTAVLVERVRELRRRGVPARAIVCVTFNKAAKAELAVRLTAGGVGDVGALTFHGLGWRVLRDAKALRDKVDGPTLAQWRMLAAQAKRAAREDGVWLDPGDAKSRLADIKLGLLQTPEQYAAATPADGERRTVAALYTAYEELQRASDRLDLADLVADALRLLRERADVRARWQGRWECVLVDEYQDIEPAQELFVRIVAAPHDQLFCVGDEDQTLYAFRRASVERIICLDERYPALERIALETNYRCPGTVVAAAARLIGHNTVSFPKTIVAAPGRERDGEIVLQRHARRVDGAAGVARTLAAHARDEIVVLARTSNALRPIALACADVALRSTGRPSSSSRRARGAPSAGISRSPSTRGAPTTRSCGPSARPRGAACAKAPSRRSRRPCAAVGRSARRSPTFPRRGAAAGRCWRPASSSSDLPPAPTRPRRSRCCAGPADWTTGSHKATTRAARTSSRPRCSTRPPRKRAS